MLFTVVLDAAAFEPLTQAREGVIAALLVLNLNALAVREAIVRRAMVADTIRYYLEEHGRAAVGEGIAARSARSAAHSKDVVAVDA